jgi:hypothetical protein
LVNRFVEAGLDARSALGRIGRSTKFPLQFGQMLLNLSSAHSAQKVHSKVHIRASVAEGGRSLSQHSQLGFRASIIVSPVFFTRLTKSYLS